MQNSLEACLARPQWELNDFSFFLNKACGRRSRKETSMAERMTSLSFHTLVRSSQLLETSPNLLLGQAGRAGQGKEGCHGEVGGLVLPP